jgi:hypothetical protein
MSVWGWIGVGVATFLVLSIAVGLAIAKILGAISSGINQILEQEGWTSAPLTRAIEQPSDDLSPRRSQREHQQSSRTRG